MRRGIRGSLGRLRPAGGRLRRPPALSLAGRRRIEAGRPVTTVLALRPRPLREVAVLRHADLRGWVLSRVVRRVLRFSDAGPVAITHIHPAAAALSRGEPARRRETRLQIVHRPHSTMTRETQRLERAGSAVAEPGAGPPGSAGPAGPRGEPGTRGADARGMVVLRRPPARLEPAAAPGPAAPLAQGPRATAERPAPVGAALTPSDLDALTHQVIRRIERRAIAQRERLGGR